MRFPAWYFYLYRLGDPWVPPTVPDCDGVIGQYVLPNLPCRSSLPPLIRVVFRSSLCGSDEPVFSFCYHFVWPSHSLFLDAISGFYFYLFRLGDSWVPSTAMSCDGATCQRVLPILLCRSFFNPRSVNSGLISSSFRY